MPSVKDGTGEISNIACEVVQQTSTTVDKAASGITDARPRTNATVENSGDGFDHSVKESVGCASHESTEELYHSECESTLRRELATALIGHWRAAEATYEDTAKRVNSYQMVISMRCRGARA